MGLTNKRAKVIFISCLIIFSSFNLGTKGEGATAIANLVFKMDGGGTRPDVGMFIAQYLRNIGIEVEVRIVEWAIFVGTLLLTHDYDIGIVGYTPDFNTPDCRKMFTEEGALNIFGLGSDIPYVNESEEIQDLAAQTIDIETRQQLYYTWQNSMMDHIVPILPLYTSRWYSAYWSNIKGIQSGWGFKDNLPYMYYDGYHTGQVSLDEYNFAGYNWIELNPLFIDDNPSWAILKFLTEPLVLLGSDFQPSKNGVINDWEQINETHLKFEIREDVYFNPSYNISDRNMDSILLSSIPTNELLKGLKNGEYSDGTNQQLTAKDAVFTLLANANPLCSDNYVHYEWISDCYVDPLNPMAFHLHIDSNHSSVEPEPYPDFWTFMGLDILPEFYLNSSVSIVTHTSGGAECTGIFPDINLTPEWQAFSDNAFSCGKYMIDYYVNGAIVVLERSPYWMGIGAIDGATDMIPFVKNINIRVISDSNSVLQEFKAGKLETVGLSNHPSERVQMDADPRFVVNTGLSSGYSFMLYNLRRPFVGGASNYEYLTAEGKEEYTKGAAVRKAMNYAIDRNTINEAVYNGEQIIIDSPMPQIFEYYYNYDIIKYDYNLNASSTWLRAAGYPSPEFPTDIEENTNNTPLFLSTITISLIYLTIHKLYRRKRYKST